MAWSKLSDLLFKKDKEGNPEQSSTIEDPGAKIYVAKNVFNHPPIEDEVVLDRHRQQIHALRESLGEAQRTIYNLMMRLEAQGNMRPTLDKLKREIEFGQAALVELSDHLLKRKPMRMRGDPLASLEQKIAEISTHLTNCYALIIKIVEYVEYGFQRVDDKYRATEGVALACSGSLISTQHGPPLSDMRGVTYGGL
jgi:hypothetical protein